MQLFSIACAIVSLFDTVYNHTRNAVFDTAHPRDDFFNLCLYSHWAIGHQFSGYGQHRPKGYDLQSRKRFSYTARAVISLLRTVATF